MAFVLSMSVDSNSSEDFMSRFRVRASGVIAAFSVAALVALAAWLTPPTRAEEKPKVDIDPSVWMKKKSQYSHQVFDGLAIGDFDKIRAGAEQLRIFNRVETFARGRTPAYRRQLENFQEANEDLIRQSETRNLEGATLAFTQMTFTCVNCHKHLRQP
jgi:hypothetical protein